MPKLDNYGQEFPYTAEWVKCAKALSVYLRLSLDQLAATKKMGLGRLRVRACEPSIGRLLLSKF